MYPNPHTAMPSAQSRTVAPETFLLDHDAQQSLPPDAIVALQQVDNCKSINALPFGVRQQMLSRDFQCLHSSSLKQIH